MEHLDPELLAQYALDDVLPGAEEQRHLAGCAVCRAEIEDLRQLAGLGHQLEPGDRLEPPPPEVWTRVADELGLRTVRDDERRRARRKVVLVGAVAAAVGVIAGVLGAQVLGKDDPVPTQPPPVASVRLGPLTGKAGDGVADLISTSAGTELRVGVNGLPAPQGFYELWLINTDGQRMVSLGVLDPRAGGTYVVPPQLTAQGYRIVDVSLEPDDGKPEHSRDSIIRGTLPS
ncbi:anti-sigma factor [Kribbella sp. NPDC056861]|uniref:anti-sigma factor n=1 Tax=Kribbella sp. NPDC056861 TaxID=3154857 RepID=UPI003418B76E